MEITGNYRQLPGAIIRYRVIRVQVATLCRCTAGEDYQSFGEDYGSPSCCVRYLSAIAELHAQSTEIIRAATRKTMMSCNPAAGGVCGRESALCTTGGSMIVLTDTRLMLVYQESRAKRR